MPSFTVSIPEDECEIVDREAEDKDRSRAAQVRVIIKEWIKQQVVIQQKGLDKE